MTYVFKEPKTIRGLQQYCEANAIDSAKWNLFIGGICLSAGAWGVFFNDTRQQYVVYRNTAKGKYRTVYMGKSEVMAVAIVKIVLLTKYGYQFKNT